MSEGGFLPNRAVGAKQTESLDELKKKPEGAHAFVDCLGNREKYRFDAHTAFRQWATGVLRDYTLRGYVVDKSRMENRAFLDDDYFERLLEEIREIRFSECRFYQKITDLYATAMDYDSRSAHNTGVLRKGAEQNASTAKLGS